MLNKIIKYSLENRFVVAVCAILLITGGLYSTKNLDIDVFPDLTAPTVVVMTDAENMATEEVERLVSFPIETAVNGATNVRRVRSASMPNSSFVWVEFDWGTDVFQARQIVSEKMVTLSGLLPEGVVPVLAPQSSVMGEIIFMGLQADSTSMMELRTLAEWVIKPTVLATGGVSQVTIIGGDYKQYQILADPVKMNTYGVTFDELLATANGLVDNSSGGVVREYGNEFAIRGMGRTTDLEEMGSTFVKMVNNMPVSLSDVADVVIGAAVRMGHASQNGKPAIIISVSKQPNINTLNVTNAIEANLTEIAKTFPKDVKLDTQIFKQADFIQTSVNNVGRALLEGAIFAIVILFLFLGSFRTTIVSIMAIPLSLLSTMLVLYLLDMSLNTMTLGGMCIAIGSLVDDAIIDVENVYKRLRQNHLKPKNERIPTLKIVYDASIEIRASILNATAITIVAFLPLLFLTGMEGRMLKPLGAAYIISLVMSLIVAMTVTPLLCRMMLSDDKYLDRAEKGGKFAKKLCAIYKRTLVWALGHGKTIVISTVVLFFGTIGIYFTLGQGFLPDFNEGSLTISAIVKPGVSLDENDKIGTLIETELLTIPEVLATARRTGRGELDEHSQSANSAEIDVDFELGDRSRAEFMEDVRAKLAAIPGIATTVGQPLGHRIDHMLSGTRANIAIKVFGTDLSELFTLGNEIKAEIEGIDGLVDVSVEQQTETPQIQIRPNRQMLARYGISMKEFNEFIEVGFSAGKVGEVFEGQRSFDLVVRLNKNYTESIDGIKSALIDTESGKKVPLDQVAEIVSVSGPNSISRENVHRRIIVSANVAGADLQGAVDKIKEAVSGTIVLPEGYRIEYGGQFENAQKASRTLVLVSLFSIGLIFMLLYIEFKDVTLSAIVLVNLPLALIGGIFAIFVSSKVVSIPSIIGFITLFGIATRNGILLISKYKSLEEEEAKNENNKDFNNSSTIGANFATIPQQSNGKSVFNNVVDGSVDRLNPILMTALTAALALIPLVANGDKSGNEIQSPMAVVVLGGLLTSTLLNVYLVPIVYMMFKKKTKKNA